VCSMKKKLPPSRYSYLLSFGRGFSAGFPFVYVYHNVNNYSGNLNAYDTGTSTFQHRVRRSASRAARTKELQPPACSRPVHKT